MVKTQIQISKETRNKLHKLKVEDQSYDDVIGILLKVCAVKLKK